MKLYGQMFMYQRAEAFFTAQVVKTEIVDSTNRGLKESADSCRIIADEVPGNIPKQRRQDKGTGRTKKVISKAPKGGKRNR